MTIQEKQSYLKKVIASPVVPSKDKMKARSVLSNIEFELAIKAIIA